MNSPSHVAFFWDRDRTFCLSPELIIELERKTGVGIGGLCRRLFAGDFRHLDILETIRLALIGGDTDPKEASSLIATYAATQPLGNMFPLAVRILEIAYFGAEPDKTTQEGSPDEK